MHWLLLFCMLLVGIGQRSVLANQDNQELSALSQFVESRWTDTEPGGGVVILKQGKVIFETYKGLRNLDPAAPITAETIFPYASITKRFTATTVLALAEDGLVDLDAAISNYLTEIDGPLGDVTVRQLLTHSGGIPSNFQAEFDQEYSTADHVEKISALELTFEPGSKSSYSNNGYNLLGALIERLTGKPWYETVLEKAVKPSGLASINYLQHHIDGHNQLAIGHWERLLAYPPAATKTASLLHANGALAGTIRDLALWTHAFHQGQFITSQSLETALEKRTLPNGNLGWGMGLFRFKYREMEAISHAGGANGINTYSLYLPHHDLIVATGTNVPQDAQDIAFGIIDCLTMGPCRAFQEIPLPALETQPLLGTYIYDDGTKEKLFISSNALFMQYEQQRPQRILFAGDNTFFVKRRRHWFTITTRDDGTTVLSFHERGSPTAKEAVKD